MPEFRPIRRRPQAGPLLAALLAMVLAGCGQLAPQSADELNASYLAALERHAPPVAAVFEPGEPAEMAALERLAGYFADLDEASARQRTASVYAPDAYLNDNLAYIQGAQAIEDYFAHAAARVDAFSVEFLDVARSGPDYYVRWVMTITAARVNGGQPMVSYGVTQFRFDAQGRVLVHKDFWDAGTGLYEYLPGVGGLVRRIRGAAEGG